MTAPVGVHGKHRPPDACVRVRGRARKATRELVDSVKGQGGFTAQDRADADSVLAMTSRALSVEQLADALHHLGWELVLTAEPRGSAAQQETAR